MKKLFSMLLVLLLIASSTLSTAFAAFEIDLKEMNSSDLETLYGQILAELGSRSLAGSENPVDVNSPILFRNNPWGTSATDFLQTLKNEGITGSVKQYSYGMESWEFAPKSGTIEAVDKLDNCGYKYTSGTSSDITVAGFKVSKIEASFLYSFDENGVYSEEGQSSLYCAKYEFNVIDGTATYSILSEKLSSLYGEGTTGNNSTGWLSTGGNYHTFTNWTVWYGTDDTGVVLWHELDVYDENNMTKKDAVYLMYGKSNSLEIMNELKSAMAREELKEALQSTSTDGL